MYLPASYQAPKDMPFGCPSGLNAVQRAACMSGQCRGQNCLYIGDARIVMPPRMPQVMQTVTPAVQVQIASATPVTTMPVAMPVPAVPATTAPAASSAAAGASAAAAPASASSSLLQNALTWVQANPLLAGGLVLGALLLMHGGKR